METAQILGARLCCLSYQRRQLLRPKREVESEMHDDAILSEAVRECQDVRRLVQADFCDQCVACTPGAACRHIEWRVWNRGHWNLMSEGQCHCARAPRAAPRPNFVLALFVAQAQKTIVILEVYCEPLKTHRIVGKPVLPAACSGLHLQSSTVWAIADSGVDDAEYACCATIRRLRQSRRPGKPEGRRRSLPGRSQLRVP